MIIMWNIEFVIKQSNVLFPVSEMLTNVFTLILP